MDHLFTFLDAGSNGPNSLAQLSCVHRDRRASGRLPVARSELGTVGSGEAARNINCDEVRIGRTKTQKNDRCGKAPKTRGGRGNARRSEIQRPCWSVMIGRWFEHSQVPSQAKAAAQALLPPAAYHKPKCTRFTVYQISKSQ